MPPSYVSSRLYYLYLNWEKTVSMPVQLYLFHFSLSLPPHGNKQGKGEMITYWLLSDDDDEEMLSSTTPDNNMMTTQDCCRFGDNHAGEGEEEEEEEEEEGEEMMSEKSGKKLVDEDDVGGGPRITNVSTQTPSNPGTGMTPKATASSRTAFSATKHHYSNSCPRGFVTGGKRQQPEEQRQQQQKQQQQQILSAENRSADIFDLIQDIPMATSGGRRYLRRGGKRGGNNNQDNRLRCFSASGREEVGAKNILRGGEEN